MSPIEILKAARELLAVPERWTKGAGARQADGGACRPDDPKAVCWCFIGALLRVNGDGEYEDVATCMDALRRRRDIQRLGVMAWHDAPDRTHAEVLDALDRTIARLEAKP